MAEIPSQQQVDGNVSNKTNKLLNALTHTIADGELLVTDYDILMTSSSIIFRLANIALNILLAVNFRQDGKEDYFVWTLCCFLIPMVITSLVQVTMYIEDHKTSDTSKLKLVWTIFWFAIIVPFLFRYWKSLYYAVKSRYAEKRGNIVKQKRYLELLIQEDSDIALIRIFECFLEAAPQKVLQISIILMAPENASIYQILAILNSMISLSWCLASYHRCIRFSQIDKVNISWAGSICMWLWHLLVTVSRVISITIIATLFPLWTIIACAVHAGVMAIWILIIDRSPFCSSTYIHSAIFSLILGAVFVFNYILPKVRRTRYRFGTFYTLCLIENIVCVVLFIVYSSNDRKETFIFLPLCFLSIVPYLLGLMFMGIYYLKFHPNIVIRKQIHNNDHSINGNR